MALDATAAAYVAMACSADADVPLDAERADVAAAAVVLGRRLIGELAAGQAELAGPLACLADDPECGRAIKTVRQRIRRMLAANLRLQARMREMVAALPADLAASEDASGLADLGGLLRWFGDDAGARAAWEDGLRLGDPGAVRRLGYWYLSRRDIAAARAVFEAARSRWPAAAALAATVELAHLTRLTDRDGDQARVLYQQVIDTGDPEWAPAALNALGRQLEIGGDAAGARAAYEQVTASGNAGETLVAFELLGDLLRGQGDTRGAQAAYQRIIDTVDAGQAQRAWVELLRTLQDAGDTDGVRAVWEQTRDAAGPVAGHALAVLGQLLEQQGDTAGARAAFWQAVDRGDTGTLASLMVLLGDQLDIPGLRAAHFAAAEAGDSEMAAGILLTLGEALRYSGDTGSARAVYRHLIRTQPGRTADRATAGLRRLRDAGTAS